tara:strand:- start:76 stop:783 length:708 start_codon:yes stop_codon:yes gene_type:complete
MSETNFYNNFVDSYNEGDIATANASLMKELANILVRNRQDFIDLLNESGIDATADMSDLTLVDIFIKNISTNKKLILGASMLVNMHNKQMGFDGEEELSDEGVKGGYDVMCSYFCGDYSYADSPIGASTLGGASSGGYVGAIAGAIGDIAKTTGKLSDAKVKKRYGVTDAASKQQEAKSEITKQLLLSKQAEMESKQKSATQKAKNKRIILIIGGSILGVIAIGVTWYFVSKRNK